MTIITSGMLNDMIPNLPDPKDYPDNRCSIIAKEDLIRGKTPISFIKVSSGGVNYWKVDAAIVVSNLIRKVNLDS